MVAVTAVPLELTVMRVCPFPSVAMATYVAVSPSPIVEDNPGVSVRTEEPRVISLPAVIIGADGGAVTAGLGVTFGGGEDLLVSCSGFALFPAAEVGAELGLKSDPPCEGKDGARREIMSRSKGSLVGVAREEAGAG